MLNRRKMLALGGLTLGGATSGSLLYPRGDQAPEPPAVTGHHHHPHVGPHGAAGQAPPITPFAVEMPVPSVLRPVRTGDGVDVYQLAIQPANVEIFPGLRTPALTYGGQFIGPTIRAKTGRRVKIAFSNRLDHAANVHVHGLYVPPNHDGYPMDVINPGSARLYEYPNTQQGATLWYHDHAHHVEADHVYRGLHGFYLIADAAERYLDLPSGSYDVPIMIRDAHFDENGAFIFDIPRNTILANGKPQPYFPVAARKYRFRLLNGANERILRLNLGGAEMIQIASDGGLLPAPVPRTELVLGSAERAEVVVDFSRYPLGTQLVLADASAGPVLRFDVVRQAADSSRVPDQLRPLPALPPATVTRDVVMSFDLSGVPLGLINGKPFDPNRVDFRIKRGATEIWRISNADTGHTIPHTFHIHLVQFRVIDRDGQAPLPDDAGRKDTVFVGPGSSVRVQATFGDYLGRYVYHCHFLEHSASGMMAQMEIVS